MHGKRTRELLEWMKIIHQMVKRQQRNDNDTEVELSYTKDYKESRIQPPEELVTDVEFENL